MPPRPPRRERSQRRKRQLWARMLSGNFAEMTPSTPFRDLLHAANLRRLYFPSEGKRAEDFFFSPLKIRRLRPGLNPPTWVLKASTLPLDHRIYYNRMGPPSYMRSVVDRNVVMRRMTVYNMDPPETQSARSHSPCRCATGQGVRCECKERLLVGYKSPPPPSIVPTEA